MTVGSYAAPAPAMLKGINTTTADPLVRGEVELRRQAGRSWTGGPLGDDVILVAGGCLDY